jgi:hypothetical protein
MKRANTQWSLDLERSLELGAQDDGVAYDLGVAETGPATFVWPGLAILSARWIARLLHRLLWPNSKLHLSREMSRHTKNPRR